MALLELDDAMAVTAHLHTEHSGTLSNLSSLLFFFPSKAV